MGRFRGKASARQQLTGFDVLLGMASTIEDDGVPFADRYVTLLQGFAQPDEMVLFGHQAVAQSKLLEHELMPANVVRLASKWAFDNRQLETLREVADVGARMATIWPRFLLATTDGHPELCQREDSPRALAQAVEDARFVIDTILSEGKAGSAEELLTELATYGLQITRRPAEGG